MKNTSVEFQIKNLEKQIKILKTKSTKRKKGKTMADLLGAYRGKLDFSLEEIKKHEYQFKNRG